MKTIEVNDDITLVAEFAVVYNVVVTAKTTSGEDVTDNALGGSLWDFWQKLINFIIEIYTQIMNGFVPSVEQGW